LILTALELERSDSVVIADKVGDTACTFLAGHYRAEQVIADRFSRDARLAIERRGDLIEAYLREAAV
jgi:hypothetical protein